MLRKICQENTVFTSGFKEMLDRRNLWQRLCSGKGLRRVSGILQRGSNPRSVFNTKKSGIIKDSCFTERPWKRCPRYSTIRATTVTSSNPWIWVDDIFQTLVNDPVTYQDMFKLFKRDTSIFNHSANVCLLSVSFGIHLGLDQKKSPGIGPGRAFP